MPTCTATTTRNLWTVTVGPWAVGSLKRTAAGFEFTAAPAMDEFNAGPFADAKAAQAAITEWYAGQEALACD
ncbi:hypothetical protein [Vulcanococcus sp.]|uniref:hypothetical protein n=1 Tax=Vulcanococcus sp. TaxID=2856995 RepID=UPI003C052A9E